MSTEQDDDGPLECRAGEVVKSRDGLGFPSLSYFLQAFSCYTTRCTMQRCAAEFLIGSITTQQSRNDKALLCVWLVLMVCRLYCRAGTYYNWEAKGRGTGSSFGCDTARMAIRHTILR